MIPFHQVKQIYDLMKMNNKDNFALLHCISSYPTPFEDVNLKVIQLYKNTFPDIIIGYSGHEMGTEVTIAATVLGARVRVIIRTCLKMIPSNFGAPFYITL